jgi:hypothetical protein
MKRKNTVLNMAMMTVVFGTVVPAVRSRSAEVGRCEAQRFARQDPSGERTEAKTFTGTIWMNGGRFVLRDERKKLWYQLDDQKLVAKFEGKQVKVIGTLDAANSQIHVQRIEEG